MQDNRYTPDPAFTDFAWAKMEALLDKEMPRTPLAWWKVYPYTLAWFILPVISGIAVVLWFVEPNQQTEKTVPKTEQQEQLPAPIAGITSQPAQAVAGQKTSNTPPGMETKTTVSSLAQKKSTAGNANPFPAVNLAPRTPDTQNPAIIASVLKPDSEVLIAPNLIPKHTNTVLPTENVPLEPIEWSHPYPPLTEMAQIRASHVMPLEKTNERIRAISAEPTATEGSAFALHPAIEAGVASTFHGKSGLVWPTLSAALSMGKKTSLWSYTARASWSASTYDWKDAPVFVFEPSGTGTSGSLSAKPVLAMYDKQDVQSLGLSLGVNRQLGKHWQAGVSLGNMLQWPRPALYNSQFAGKTDFQSLSAEELNKIRQQFNLTNTQWVQPTVSRSFLYSQVELQYHLTRRIGIQTSYLLPLQKPVLYPPPGVSGQRWYLGLRFTL